MVKKNSILWDILIRIIYILIAIILGIIAVEAFFLTAKFRNEEYNCYNEYADLINDNFFINVLFSFLFLLLIFLLNKIISKINNKIVLIISLIVVSIVGFFWVNMAKAPLRADSKMVYKIALEFLGKNYSSYQEANYMFVHPMQIGIVLFIELFYKIIPVKDAIVFQNFNVILVVGCFYVLYKITEKIYKDNNVNKLFLILSACFVILPMASVLVYGNIVGLLFSLLAIYYMLEYFDNRKNLNLILIFLFLSISLILKSNYLIIMIAVIIVLFIDLVLEKKWKNLILIFLIGIFAITYNNILNCIISKKIDIEVNEGTPMISYIAMGMYKEKDRAPGWYNISFNVESVYRENNYDAEETRKACNDVIIERIEYFKENPLEFLKYYHEKIGTTWLEPAFQVIWTSESMEETTLDIMTYLGNNKIVMSVFSGKISIILMKFLDVLEIVIMGMSSFGLIIDIIKKKYNYKKMILVLSFLGGFLFHILWETKSIYALPFYFLLLPSAASGINILEETLKNKLNLFRGKYGFYKKK